MVHLRDWKLKRLVLLICALMILYLTLRIQNYSYKDTVFLKKIKVVDAWEFVADFSNMKYLNPTIVDFSILSDSGNYNHWKYTVQYTENLSHWPYLYNIAIAEYDIHSNLNQKVYTINSVHRTCLLYGMLCLDATSEFKFNNSSHDFGTDCQENVIYQCPTILSRFCYKEVQFQRMEIMKNLKKHFLNLSMNKA